MLKNKIKFEPLEDDDFQKRIHLIKVRVISMTLEVFKTTLPPAVTTTITTTATTATTNVPIEHQHQQQQQIEHEERLPRIISSHLGPGLFFPLSLYLYLILIHSYSYRICTTTFVASGL